MIADDPMCCPPGALSEPQLAPLLRRGIAPHPFDISERSIVFSRDTLDNRRPRVLSRRRPEAVIDPSGNARAAATDRRSGVSGPICSRWRGERIKVIVRLRRNELSDHFLSVFLALVFLRGTRISTDRRRSPSGHVNCSRSLLPTKPARRRDFAGVSRPFLRSRSTTSSFWCVDPNMELNASCLMR